MNVISSQRRTAGRDIAKRGKGMTREIQVSTRTLIVLCGMAGAGKSTFARQHFEPTHVVSSDTCRALICDSERNIHDDPDTFDLFHYILQKRLNRNRLAVADSTALHDFARRRLLDLARRADYQTCLDRLQPSPHRLSPTRPASIKTRWGSRNIRTGSAPPGSAPGRGRLDRRFPPTL